MDAKEMMSEMGGTAFLPSAAKAGSRKEAQKDAKESKRAGILEKNWPRKKRKRHEKKRD